MKLIPPRYSVFDTPPSQKILLKNSGILWILLSLFIALVSTFMLPVDIIIKIIIILVILFLPSIGDIVEFIVIIGGIIVLFTSQFTTLSFLFIIASLAYFWFVLSPFLINTVYVSAMEHRSNRK